MMRLHGLFAGLAMTACSEPPPGAPPTEATPVHAEATNEAAPIASSSATATSEVAVLSAESPPPAPPPPPSATMSARKAELSKDLAQLEKLDMEMMRALSSSGLPQNALRDSQLDLRLLEGTSAGTGTGTGSLNMGGRGHIRAGGGGGGLGGLGNVGRPASFAIGGKAAKDLTATDIDAALVRAGCTATRLDSPSSPSDGPAVALFEAKCPGNTFTVRFVPVGATRPDAKAIVEMGRLGAVWEESGMLLAILPNEKDTRPAAVALLDKLRTSENSAPKGQASVGGASVSGGSISNAGAVVAGMAAGFRRCYNRGLTEDKTMKGTVRITAKIGPNGEVLSASPSGGGGLSTTVTSCVAGVVSSRQFAAPDGGSATVVIPVSFTPMQ